MCSYTGRGTQVTSSNRSIRAAGHVVHAPTVKGNRPGDVKNVGLPEAIESIIEFLDEHELEDIVLVGHSYGGMIIPRSLTGCLTTYAGSSIGTPSSLMTGKAFTTC